MNKSSSSIVRIEQVEQVTIVGTGLLGASIGLALKAGGYRGRVVGVARRAAAAEQARTVGAIDIAATALAPAIRESQLVILAVPLGAFESVLAQIAPLDHPSLIVTDVGSTKTSVLAAARRHLPRPSRFVGAHPMAGSEQRGPAAACARLFQGKPCILTPEPDTDPHALALIEALWARLGMTLLRMTPAAHDRAVATVSHLPHAMATLLVQIAQQCGDDWRVASTGFRDTTRLASSNPPMRADILTANREAVLEALGAMRERIDAFAALLERNDRDGLLAMLEDSRVARERWLGQSEDTSGA